MTTTTTQESYVVYALNPDPFPDSYPASSHVRYDDRDKKFATTICLFTIITSVVLICLFFLIGHSFGYILFIIILILFVSLLIAYMVRRPAILFGHRFGQSATSVKIPNYALHVIPAAQLAPNTNNNIATNSGYYVYPNVYPAPVYTERKTTNY